MIRIQYSPINKIYYAISEFAEKDILKSAGFLWDKTVKRWYTADWRIAKSMAQYANADTLKALELAERNAEHEVEDSMNVNNDSEIPVPDGLEYLPFQKAGIDYISRRQCALLADAMGTGKSVQSIGLINKLAEIQRVLIVCPATLKINWRNELNKWLVRKRDIKVVGATDREYEGTEPIVIVNYDMLKLFFKKVGEAKEKPKKNKQPIDSNTNQFLLFGRSVAEPKSKSSKKKLELELINNIGFFDLIICDEAHVLKNRNSIRTQMVKALFKACRRRLFLTGTPIINKPIEIYQLAYMLKAPITRDFWAFVKKFCAAVEKQYSHDQSGWDMSGASNLEELQTRLREEIMIRRTKEEVLKELPPKMYQIIEVPNDGFTNLLEKEQQFLFDLNKNRRKLSASKNAAVNSDKVSYESAVKELNLLESAAFNEIEKIRYETAVAKLPFALEHIEDAIEATGKVVVFAHHREILSKIQERFPDISVKIDGGTPMDDRQNLVDKFQNDDNCKLFIGSIRAAGVGITLTKSSLVIFIESDWTPAMMEQSEDRLHRISQLNPVLVQHLVIDGSIDAQLARVLVKKQKIIRKALNADEMSQKINLSDIIDWDLD